MNRLLKATEKEFADYVLQRSEIVLKPRTKKEALEYLKWMETEWDYENSAWESWYLSGYSDALHFISSQE